MSNETSIEITELTFSASNQNIKNESVVDHLTF